VQVQFMVVVVVEEVLFWLLLRQHLIMAAVHFMAAAVAVVVTQLLLRVTAGNQFGEVVVLTVQQAQTYLQTEDYPPVVQAVQKQQTQVQVVVVEFASLIGKRTL
jgi:hypothetical protein